MVIKAKETGKCPYCAVTNRFEEATTDRFHSFTGERLIHGNKDYFTLEVSRCTACGKNVIFWHNQMILPLGSSRPHCPKEVPKNIAKDYEESCLVEHLSPKAAAALARRCLQNMLHEQGIKKRDLSEEIKEAMKKLPSHLSEAIDSIRNIGNFGTHPIKSTDTGLIVEVEEGEAEWNLNTIEQLFDFYYVQPAKTKLKRNALNLKLKEVGKPEMK